MRLDRRNRGITPEPAKEVTPMSAFLSAIKEINTLAEKSKQSVPTFMAVAIVLAERDEQLHFENSAAPDEKSKITAYLDGLNGQISPELSTREVHKNAGVRTNRGTTGYARSEIKRLLIQYHKS